MDNIDREFVITGGSIRFVFGKSSFGKHEKPMYDEDRTINRHFGE